MCPYFLSICLLVTWHDHRVLSLSVCLSVLPSARLSIHRSVAAATNRQSRNEVCLSVYVSQGRSALQHIPPAIALGAPDSSRGKADDEADGAADGRTVALDLEPAASDANLLDAKLVCRTRRC
jgi:hypothetical protein